MLKYLREKIFNVRSFFPILLLSVLFFLGGCEKKEFIEPLTNTQKTAFGYLPYESGFVMFLNLDELRKTDFWESYFKSSLFENNSDDHWLRKLENESGVGLNNGISQIFISSGTDANDAAMIILDENSRNIKNNFDNNKDFIKKNIADKSIYELKGKFPLKFYFANDTMLLVAKDLNYIKSVINKKNNSLNNNKIFIGTIKSIKNKKQYWIASDKGEYIVDYITKFFNFEKRIPVNNILKSIKSVSLSAKFEDGLDLESKLNCSNSKNAYLLSTVIKGALAMDLLSGGDYSFGKILQKTDVERQNSQINIQLELGKDEIITLKDFAKQKKIERKL